MPRSSASLPDEHVVDHVVEQLLLELDQARCALLALEHLGRLLHEPVDLGVELGRADLLAVHYRGDIVRATSGSADEQSRREAEGKQWTKRAHEILQGGIGQASSDPASIASSRVVADSVTEAP
jgi:hypothetical protein